MITGFLLIIAIGFLAGLFVSPPSAVDIAAGLVPRFDGMDSVLLAAAMLGATVMPHAVYLHSALTRDRFGRVEPGLIRRQLLTATKTDVVLAMLVAGTRQHCHAAAGGRRPPGSGRRRHHRGCAYTAITTIMGPTIGILFAVGLLASGLASTSVGNYAGSVIMEGLLARRVNPLLRRVITLAPALLILAIGADPTSVLIISQVVLSFGLPFVLVPLMRLTSDRKLMGDDVNRAGITIVGWIIIAGYSR